MSFIPPGWGRDRGGNKGWVSMAGGAASICLYLGIDHWWGPVISSLQWHLIAQKELRVGLLDNLNVAVVASCSFTVNIR